MEYCNTIYLTLLSTLSLLLSGVGTSEHIVDLGEVVGTLGDGGGISLRLKVLLEMGLLTENAQIVVDLWLNDSAGSELSVEVEGVLDGGGVTGNSDGEEGGGETGTIGEETNTLALEVGWGNVGNEGNKSRVQRSSVHVTALGGSQSGWLDTLGETLLGEGHEGLLESTVLQGIGVAQGLELLWDSSELLGLWVGEEVVVKEAGIRLLDELAGWGVESQVVESLDSLLSLSSSVSVKLCVQGLLSGVVGLVASVNGLSVAADGVVTIDVWVLGGQVWLVEVVGVLHVRTSLSWLEDELSIWANEHGNNTNTTGWSGGTLLVKSNVTSNNDSVSSIPSRGFHPVDSVEQSVGSTVAGVDGIDTLNVGVSVWGKELHQHGLDGLGLVQQSLGSDLQTTNAVWVDVVLLKQVAENSEGERVDVCNEGNLT